MQRLALVLSFAALGCGVDTPGLTDSNGSTSATGSGSGTTSDGLSASGGNMVTTTPADDSGTPPDTGTPDTGTPDTGTPDTGAPETGTPGDSSGPGDGSTTDPGSSSSDDGVNDTGTPAGCGDGMVEPGEQCDGENLQGFDCASLGLGEGTLMCDPVTCTFDTSMCMAGGGTGFGAL